jgi:hypothetical protein
MGTLRSTAEINLFQVYYVFNIYRNAARKRQQENEWQNRKHENHLASIYCIYRYKKVNSVIATWSIYPFSINTLQILSSENQSKTNYLDKYVGDGSVKRKCGGTLSLVEFSAPLRPYLSLAIHLGADANTDTW